MRRTSLVLLIIFLLLFPLGVLVVVNFDTLTAQIMARKYSVSPSKSSQFTASSESPGLKPTIVHTAFLEYEFARLGVFKANAITDPEAHRNTKMPQTSIRCKI
jgi:hypothetical protein